MFTLHIHEISIEGIQIICTNKYLILLTEQCIEYTKFVLEKLMPFWEVPTVQVYERNYTVWMVISFVK